MADGERERFLTPSEAAEILGVHPRTLSRWEQAGQLQVIKTVGGHRRYRRAEVMALRGTTEGRAPRRPPEPAAPAQSGEAPRPGDRTAARRRALEVLHAADVAGGDPRQELTERDPPLTRALVEGVRDHLTELDRLISQRAERWTIDRMPVVDRNLLRLGAFELLHTDTPAGVVIDQAVGLARLLSTEESGRFVNGLLGRIARERNA